uniref:Ig-like domain-containing protein n=1 Tax=Setaria digitata TaxID=48799 RepID=A0A915PXF3_9BILA
MNTMHYYITNPIFLTLLLLFNCTQAIITTKGRLFIVDEGDSVHLPCNIHNIAEDAVVIWKRGEQVLFTDEEIFHEDQRFQLHREDNNFTLVIDRVEPYDGAKYVCEITSPEMSITHTLEVNGAAFIFLVHPTVSISPDTNPLLVNVGENVVIKCSVSGNPPPKVTWTRQDSRKMPVRATSKDGQLRITRVTVDDTGVYECTASNNVGADAHDMIEVRVQGENFAHERSLFIKNGIEKFIAKIAVDVSMSSCHSSFNFLVISIIELIE